MLYTQAHPFAQSHSVDRRVEDIVLNKIALSQAIDATIPVLYKRMILKLHAIDGWDPGLISDCAGIPKENVEKTIRRLRPRVLKVIRQINHA